eukprot:779817-Pleurochrysis_carterae.AAC.1
MQISLEIIGGVFVAVTGALVTYIVRTRTNRIKLCCGVIECFRRARRASVSERSCVAEESIP